MVIIETAVFAKRRVELIGDDDAFRAFCISLAERPEQGDLVRGIHGLRKLRAAMLGHGKSRGGRVYYFYAKPDQIILLLAMLPKNEGEQLTKDQEHKLSDAVRKEFG